MKSNIENAKEMATVKLKSIESTTKMMLPGALQEAIESAIFQAYLEGWEGHRTSADYLNRPPIPLTEKPFLTLDEAALYIGISKSSLYKLTHKKEITYSRPTGRNIFFERSDLDTWLRKNRKAAYCPA